VSGRVALARPVTQRPKSRQPGHTDQPGQAGQFGGGAIGNTPVQRLGRRLQALTPDHPQRYAVTQLSAESDPGPEWLRIAGVVPAMLSRAGAHLSLSPAVAGARMAGTLGYAVAGRLAVALAVTGQAFDVGPDSLMVQLDGDGLIERIGVRSPVLMVSAADPSIGPGPYPITRLADFAAVIAWSAARAWTTLGPLVDELHETVRYGRVPMWNLVGDAVLGPTTIVPRLAGGDQRAGRATGSAFLDALVEQGAPIRRRGTLRPPPTAEIPTSRMVATELLTTEVLTPVRGSCCLHFRQTQEMCASCPLAES
jgi:hypothetical protein